MFLLSFVALYAVFFVPRPSFHRYPGNRASPFQGFLFHLQNKTDGILSVRFIWWSVSNVNRIIRLYLQLNTKCLFNDI